LGTIETQKATRYLQGSKNRWLGYGRLKLVAGGSQNEKETLATGWARFNGYQVRSIFQIHFESKRVKYIVVSMKKISSQGGQLMRSLQQVFTPLAGATSIRSPLKTSLT